MSITLSGVSIVFKEKLQRALLRDQLFGARTSLEKESRFGLRDITFSIPNGECVAIVGANGAGKSTLLNVIVGALPPDTGQLSVDGSVASLLELGSGFHPDLTGRENLYMNAAILGLSWQETRNAEDNIVTFSELGAMIDQPVRTYSTGMYFRLGFAIAIHCSADAFVMDEIFAVGDEYFQRKCFERLASFKSQGKTLVIATHSPSSVETLCTRALWLNKGRIVYDGTFADVVKAYTKFSHSPEATVGAVVNLDSYIA